MRIRVENPRRCQTALPIVPTVRLTLRRKLAGQGNPAMAALPIPPARPLSPVIITPDVWPTGRPAIEAALETWTTKRDQIAAELAVCSAAITQIQCSAQSNGFDAMYEKYCENYAKLAAQLDRIEAIADVQRRSIRETAELERHLENLDWRTHQEIASRGLPVTSPAALEMAAQANAYARSVSSSTGETIAAWTANFTEKLRTTASHTRASQTRWPRDWSTTGRRCTSRIGQAR
jgi:hypothetical protein